MLRTAPLLAGLLSSSMAAGADCILVRAGELRELDTEYGITSAEWSAEIRNRCDDPYDATLTIRFIDADGEAVHETVEVVIVESRGIEQSRHPVSMPADRFAAIERIEISIEERARPI